MTDWLAVQVEWVRNSLSDSDFIAAADKIGYGDKAREQVRIYHDEFERPHHDA